MSLKNSVTIDGLLDELKAALAQVTRERDEALEQQRATSEVLQVISSSPGALELVFQAILENAVRICDAKFGVLLQREGGAFRAVAFHGVPPALIEERRRDPLLRPTPGTALGRLIETKQTIQVADVQTDPAFQADPVRPAGLIGAGGARTLISVPMLRDDELIGAIGIYRQEVRPFSHKQIELVQNFAAQAVIAVENTRLLNELRQRTNDLTESLEQQTATSEVLKVISSSAGELEPVFQAMLENGTRLCEAKFGIMWLREGDKFRCGALHNAPPEFVESRRREVISPHPDSPLARAARTKQAVHIADLRAESAYVEGSRPLVDLVELGGARSILVVPLLKDNESVGVIAIYRKEIGLFNDKQVSLLTGFAAQAVIAIENTRLLNELRQRTDDLTESLQQQTATSEILEVISNSPTDTQPAFDAIVRSGLKLFPDAVVAISLPDDDQIKLAAIGGEDEADLKRLRGRYPMPLSREFITGSAILNQREIDITDARNPPEELIAGAKNLLAGNHLAMTVVPMMRGKAAVGAINVVRHEPGPLSDRQRELLRTFAAQAVIAIENTRLFNELRQRTDDLTESLEQQTATGEILASISGSMADTKPVFDAIVRNLLRLFGTRFAVVQVLRDGMVHMPAVDGDSGFEKIFKNYPRPLDDSTGGGVAMLTKQVVQFSPIQDNPAVPGTMRQFSREFGFDSNIFAPMLRDGRVIGVIGVARKEARPFSDKHVALIKAFAAQAVIAIENTRLFNELRERTADLTEALEQQTATAEVLSVMSRSKFDLVPVLQSVVDTAAKLCRADQAVIFRLEDGLYRFSAGYSLHPEYLEIERATPIAPGSGTVVGRAAMSRAVARIDDAMSDAGYEAKEQAAIAHLRSIIGVPLLRDGEPIGVIALARCRVEPFSDREIDLVTTFADQAVIAIENVRLFDEIQDALARQTATSEILRAISHSLTDISPVFDAILENAIRLCGGNVATLWRFDGQTLRFAAGSNTTAEGEAYLRSHPLELGTYNPTVLAGLEQRTVHELDVFANPVYRRLITRGTPTRRPVGSTVLAVPLVRDGNLLGVITIWRFEKRPFTDKQVELVTTFADQAVIAIENVRLFDEVQARTKDLEESLQQQTATADVLKVISRATFDLQAVLETLVESAARLCEADSAAVHRPVGDAYPYVASYGFSQQWRTFMHEHPITAGRGSVLGRAVLEGETVHVVDVESDPDYGLAEAQKKGGWRTVLGVPLMREGTPIGVIMLTRNQVRPFTDKQIALATTFADQAVIAIENVRLFNEIQEKSHQLEEASKHKSQFLANMSHELRTPLNAILGYTELIVDGVYGETPEKVQNALQRITTNGRHLLGLINDVLDLSKIEAGQLTLSLADYSMKDVVHSVYAAVEPLAAEKQIGLKAEIASDLPTGRGDERRLTQVLLNLVSNAVKFTDEGEVKISACAGDGHFSVAVVDTGPGISADDQKKLFQEFQQADSSTTKKKGGTGLGLAISKKIVEMHGGSVQLDSKLGEGSTFSFTVPLRAEQAKR